MIRLVILATWLLAQTTPSFRASVDLVTVPCTILDQAGRPVTDLSREEFRVYDNGARKIVQNLWFDTVQPLTLGIVIDISDSQGDQIVEHRETAVALLQRILRPGDQAFVISVGEDVRVWANVAGTVAEIRKQLESGSGDLLVPPCPKRPSGMSACGGSPLWNAIYETARLKLRPLGGNKALMILTDGFDTGSTHTWRQAADEVSRANASVYAIQYRSSLGARFSPDLYRMLEESAGAWFGAPAGDYNAIVSRIDTDLRHRYILTFHPDTTGGKVLHDLRVEVTRPDLKIRARTAYVSE